MFGAISLILITLPIFFQLIFGTMAAKQTISFKFWTVSSANFVLQIFFSIVSYSIASYNFNTYFDKHPSELRCGTGFGVLIMAIFFLMFFLIILIIIQYFIKRFYKKRYH